MKKICYFLIFFMVLSLPALTLAQSTPMFSIHNPIGFGTIQDVIRAIIQVAFIAAGLVAVAYIIVGGYRYITSSGNPEATEAAKGTIINSIIGLIIIFAASLIVSYILSSLHVGSLYQFGSTSPSVIPSETSSVEDEGLPNSQVSPSSSDNINNKSVSPPPNKSTASPSTSRLPSGT